MTALRKLAGQTAIYGVSSILGRLFNYLLVPLHTRVFAEDAFGEITQLYAMVAVLMVTLTYGMETAFFRFAGAEPTPEGKRRVFSTAFISILVTTSLFLLAVLTHVGGIAQALHFESNPQYITYFALIVGLDVLSTVPFARLRLLNKAGSFVLVNLGSIGLYILLNVFFLLYCPAVLENNSLPGSGFIEGWYNPEFGIGYVFVANIISSAFKFLLLTPGLRDALAGWHKSVARRLFPYAVPLLFLSLAGIINEAFDRVFFVRLSILPEEEAKAQLGIYGACYKVAMLLSIGIQAYRFAAEPFIFNLGKRESESTQAVVMKYYAIVAALITLGLLCFLDIAMLMVGEAMREGRGVVPILLLAYVCFGVVFNLSFWFKLNDKTLYGTLIAAVGALLTVVLNIWLIPIYSYYGCAIATLAAYVGMMLLSYYLGQRHHPIDYPLKEIFLYFGAAALLYVLHYLLDLSGGWQFLSGGIAVALYLGLVLRREGGTDLLNKFKNG